MQSTLSNKQELIDKLVAERKIRTSDCGNYYSAVDLLEHVMFKANPRLSWSKLLIRCPELTYTTMRVLRKDGKKYPTVVVDSSVIPTIINKLTIFSKVHTNVSKENVIYLIQNTVTTNVKIGYTSNLKQRLRDIQISNDCELKVLSTINGNIELEQKLHKQFKKYHIRGEWFRFGDEIKKYFKNSVDKCQHM